MLENKAYKFNVAKITITTVLKSKYFICKLPRSPEHIIDLLIKKLLSNFSVSDFDSIL